MSPDRKDHFNLMLENLLRDVEALNALSGEAPAREVTTSEGAFRLQVTEDRMAASIDLFPSFGGGAPLDFESIREALAREGIVTADLETLRQAVTDCEAEKIPRHRVLIAEGKAPVDPVEGRLELLFDLELPPREEIAPAEEGAVDHRERGPILSVQPGQTLAILHPALPGKAGFDVYGLNLAPPEPSPATLIAGPGVSTEDGIRFAAETWGQPHLDGGTLSVLPVLAIDGDVDYATGNLRFDGNISIAGGVREGFLVQAGFDIDVKGYVESAVLRAGRHIRVQGGIVGEKALIEAKGSLQARFIERGKARADGPVVIDSHALHAQIFSRDRVLVSGKRGILGGAVLALKRIEAESAGSPMGSQTHLIVGEDFLLRERLEELEADIAFREKTLLRIADTVHHLKERLDAKGLTLPPDSAEKLRLVLDQYQLLQAALAELREERGETMTRLLQEAQGGIVAVRRILYPGTTVTIQGRNLAVTEEERFVSLSLDRESLTVVRSPFA